MLDIGSKLPTPALREISRQTQLVSASSKSAVKTGAIIVLSPTALKLSRELTAIQTDPNKEPLARLEASAKLRQLALQVFTGE